MVHVLSSDASQVQAEGWSPGCVSAYSKGENEEVKIVITTTKPAGQWWHSTLIPQAGRCTGQAPRQPGQHRETLENQKPKNQANKAVKYLGV